MGEGSVYGSVEGSVEESVEGSVEGNGMSVHGEGIAEC
jgi:hypothetical protein